jgi:methyl-accepting chemotaxis protein
MDSGNEVSAKAGEAFERIVEGVGKTSGSIERIEAATVAQSDAARAVEQLILELVRVNDAETPAGLGRVPAASDAALHAVAVAA